MEHESHIPKQVGANGYKKTTFRHRSGATWDLIEDQEELDVFTTFAPEDRPERIVILIHPSYEQFAAFNAVNPFTYLAKFSKTNFS